MGRSPCCSKVGLNRGPWSIKEDTLLANYIQQNGEGNWRSLPKNAGLLRCGKSCRLRWMNYLRPGILRGNITQDEEDLIVRLHGLLGNRWSLIAGRLPGRTDNEIKNYWNTHLLKKLKNAGKILITHPKPNLSKAPKKAKKVKPKKVVADEEMAAIKKNNEDQELEQISSNNNDVDVVINDLDQKKKATKVLYMPKPIRVSSTVFDNNRNKSYDSLVSSSSSDYAEKAVSNYVPTMWDQSMFDHELEINNNNYNYAINNYENDDDDFLLGVVGCILPEDSMSGDVNILDKVYDEYLQLL